MKLVKIEGSAAYSVQDNAKLAGVIGPIPHWTDALDRYLLAKDHVTSPV